MAGRGLMNSHALMNLLVIVVLVILGGGVKLKMHDLTHFAVYFKASLIIVYGLT